MEDWGGCGLLSRCPAGPAARGICDVQGQGVAVGLACFTHRAAPSPTSAWSPPRPHQQRDPIRPARPPRTHRRERYTRVPGSPHSGSGGNANCNRPQFPRGPAEKRSSRCPWRGTGDCGRRVTSGDSATSRTPSRLRFTPEKELPPPGSTLAGTGSGERRGGRSSNRCAWGRLGLGAVLQGPGCPG